MRARCRVACACLCLALLCAAPPCLAGPAEDEEAGGAKDDVNAADKIPAAEAQALIEEGTAGAAAKASVQVSSSQPASTPAAPEQTQPTQSQPTQPQPAPAPKKVGRKSKIVEVAPEAELQNDNDDIDPAGACAAFVKGSSCKDKEAGSGALAQCISDLLAAADAGDSQDTESVPEACQQEVAAFMIARNKNINANLPLAMACKKDAEALCNNSGFVGGPQDGRVIGCLRDRKDLLTKACAREVFKVQQAIARDYRADPGMAASCSKDVERLCAGVADGGGRKTACLRDNRAKLSWECQEAVFTQQMEAEDDIRLNVRLFHKCLPDKKRFCNEVPPGNAAARDCLLDHRAEPSFSAACRDELEAMLEARVRDFRIDARLRKACEGPLVELCGGSESYDGEEADMNVCLQDSADLIPEGSCRDMVLEYQKLAAQDIRFDVPLADACYDDRMSFCASVPPGSARVIRCLQNNRDKLSSTCRAQLFDEEVRFSENIDFQFPMKQACLKEIDRFCKDVPHGNARVIRCLQDNKEAKDFGKPCLKEVAAYEQNSSQDYRLNFRLRKQCDRDIEALCEDACHPSDESQVGGHKMCGGTVLRCLTEKREEIKSTACRKEVYYFEKMEVSNFHNDVILAAQCRGDVEAFCKNVEPGEGRVHACLRDHRRELSEGCRREEMLLEQQEAEHIELRPNLLKACHDERASFCSGVQPGSARVFRCLAEKLADPDFGAKCRFEVITKLQRRQANWRLDPPLRRACKADVADMCKAEDTKASEAGEVYSCLLHNFDDLDPGCKKELGRAVHMAFFIWSPGAILTRGCDSDVTSLCLSQRPNMDRVPGAVGSCLADILERAAAADSASRKMVKDKPEAAGPRLSDQCRLLADVAEPPSMQRAFDTTLSVALLESQLSALESRTGLPLLNRDRAGHARSVTLTGWTAIAGIAAMVLLAAAGATIAWRQYKGLPDASTVVLKSRPRYGRVAQNEQ